MSTSTAGLLVPLDMFRISQLAAMFGELLVGKARNILDAQLVVTRHPEVPVLLVRITGSIIEGDPAKFWPQNAELVHMASRAFPRQVIMFFAHPGDEETPRREGFLVAQQGQIVASDEGDAEQIPAGTPDNEWPLGRLCQQLRLPLADLRDNFAGGPEVSASLVEPNHVDDQALLEKLFAKEMAAQAQADADGAGGDTAADPAAQAAPGAPGQPAQTPKPSAADIAAEDAKRRAKEQAEEAAAAAARAEEIRSGLRTAQDDLGLTVAPDAELSEPDQLRPYIVASLKGDVPRGVDRELTTALQGKRIDVVVKVDFLSEVFLESTPLSKPQFLEISTERQMGGKTVRVAEVLGPRLGYGTLVSSGSAPHVFVSRKPDLPLPEALILELLG